MAKPSAPKLPPAPPPDTWGRFINMAKGQPKPAPNFSVAPRHVQGNVPQGMEFMLRKPGAASWGGSLAPTKTNPYELYVEGLHSSASRRTGVGDLEQGMMNYKMDISSPAQRELPLRGMKLPASEKGRGAFRTREERVGYESGGPPPAPMRDKQAAIDRMLDMARRSGFKSMSFSAEPGERPRLYEKLMGYKAQPQGEEDIHSMLGRMTGRAPSGPSGQRGPSNQGQYSAPFGREAIGTTRNMTPEGIEYALGLSIDEAKTFGLVNEVGPRVFRLTDQGAARAIDWFGEGTLP